ncbi:DUF4880 domain-containing protein (plasmid) [Paracoccus kondratievae]|nr:DUF4880 domain-containing protein [Paracoccus kondratievae]
MGSPDDQALEWLVRVNDERADDGLRAEFTRWLAVPEHVEAWVRAEAFWNRLQPATTEMRQRRKLSRRAAITGGGVALLAPLTLWLTRPPVRRQGGSGRIQRAWDGVQHTPFRGSGQPYGHGTQRSCQKRHGRDGGGTGPAIRIRRQCRHRPAGDRSRIRNCLAAWRPCVPGDAAWGGDGRAGPQCRVECHGQQHGETHPGHGDVQPVPHCRGAGNHRADAAGAPDPPAGRRYHHTGQVRKNFQAAVITPAA